MTKNNSKPMREQRAAQAAERQAAHDKLSIQEKIVKAASRQGESYREITRLGVEAGIYPATISEDRKRAKNG